MDSTSIVVLTAAFLAVISIFLYAMYRRCLKKGRFFAELLNEFEGCHIRVEKEKAY
jgi:hypothetical protein